MTRIYYYGHRILGEREKKKEANRLRAHDRLGHVLQAAIDGGGTPRGFERRKKFIPHFPESRVASRAADLSASIHRAVLRAGHYRAHVRVDGESIYRRRGLASPSGVQIAARERENSARKKRHRAVY